MKMAACIVRVIAQEEGKLCNVQVCTCMLDALPAGASPLLTLLDAGESVRNMGNSDRT